MTNEQPGGVHYVAIRQEHNNDDRGALFTDVVLKVTRDIREVEKLVGGHGIRVFVATGELKKKVELQVEQL